MIDGARVHNAYKKTDAGAIPGDWEAEPLGQHDGIRSGESPSLFVFGDEGVPYFKVEQLNNNSKYLTDTPYFIATKKSVSSGSLIFPKRGASILLNKIRILAQDSFMDTNMMTLTPAESVDHEYLYYALTHVELWQIADTTSIPQINNKHIKPLVLAIPSPPEQRAIAAALSDVDALLGVLDRLIAKKRDLKQAAMQQLLTGRTRLPGFRGRWEETTLGQIGDCVIGLTYAPENVIEHGLLVLRSSNVQDGKLAYEDNVHVNLKVPDHLYTRPGDILVCVRNGSRSLIGKCALIDEDAAGVTFGAFMSIYRTKHSRFVFQAFGAADIQRQIRDNIGATINQITTMSRAQRQRWECRVSSYF